VELENVFEVGERREVVWDVLMDVPRVVPCLPGATLTETLGDDHWKAELMVRLGPVSMTFDADVTRQSADPVAGKVSLAVKAREKSGRGAATAEILSALDPVDGGTKVTLTTSMRLQGAVARIGRSEIVEEVSQQMVDSFATCLKGKMTGQLAAGEAPKPPSVIRMVLRSLWLRVRRAFRRGG
jgi:carbon monoxide dehydrogenase subunit G